MPTRPRPPDGDHGVGDFQHQPGPLLDGAAIGVGAMVRDVLQELVEQVAVGAMDFDAVETGGLGVLGAAPVGFDDRRGFH